MAFPLKPRILLIEDDPDDVLITQRLLAGAFGTEFVLEHCAAAPNALAALRSGAHDVALLDYRLGSTSGLDVLREACCAAGCPVAVILLTGVSDRAIDVAAMAAGAADYLVKGQITPAMLERALRYAHGRHRAHQELEQRVAERTAELARARDDAERASRVKGEFLSRMSHELRTPMHAIMGFAELLAMDELTLEQRGSIGQILQASGRLLGLIDEVLSISEFRSGVAAESETIVNIGEVVEAACDQHLDTAQAAAVAIDPVPLSMRQRRVRGDRKRLIQAFAHLVGNAVKFNGRGGSVGWALGVAPDGRLSISIKDTGRGIAATDLSRLFIPFERLDAEERGIAGAGLGLAVSRWIIEAMGGELGVESTLGDGSTFTVLLPESCSSGA